MGLEERPGDGWGRSLSQPSPTPAPAGERKTSLLAHAVGTKGAAPQTPAGLSSRRREPPRQRADVPPGAEGPPQAPPLDFSNHRWTARREALSVAEEARLPAPAGG